MIRPTPHDHWNTLPPSYIGFSLHSLQQNRIKKGREVRASWRTGPRQTRGGGAREDRRSALYRGNLPCSPGKAVTLQSPLPLTPTHSGPLWRQQGSYAPKARILTSQINPVCQKAHPHPPKRNCRRIEVRPNESRIIREARPRLARRLRPREQSPT